VSKLKRGYLYIYHLHTTERVLTETRGYSNNTQKENIMAGKKSIAPVTESYDGGQSFYGDLNQWLDHVKKQQSSAGSDINPVLKDVELRAAKQYYNKHIEHGIDFTPEIWDNLYTEGARPFDITEWASEIRKQKGIELSTDEVLKRLDWLNVAVDPDVASKNPEAFKELFLLRQDQRYNASGDSKPLKALAPGHPYSYWAGQSIKQIEETSEFTDLFKEMVESGDISYDVKNDPRGVLKSGPDVNEGSMIEGASFGYGDSLDDQISNIDSERSQFMGDVNMAHNIAADPTGAATIADFDGDAKELQRLTRMVGAGFFTLDGDIEYGKLGNITGGNATLVPTKKLASMQTTADMEDAFEGAFEKKHNKTTKGERAAGNLPHITIAGGSDKVMGLGGMADPGKGGGMSEILAQGKNIKGSKLSVYDYIKAIDANYGESLTRDQLMELMESHGIPESSYDVAEEFVGSNYVDLPQDQQVLMQTLAKDGEIVIHPSGEIGLSNTHTPNWVTDSQGVVRDVNQGPTLEGATKYLQAQESGRDQAFKNSFWEALESRHGMGLTPELRESANQAIQQMTSGGDITASVGKLRALGIPPAAITMLLNEYNPNSVKGPSMDEKLVQAGLNPPLKPQASAGGMNPTGSIYNANMLPQQYVDEGMNADATKGASKLKKLTLAGLGVLGGGAAEAAEAGLMIGEKAGLGFGESAAATGAGLGAIKYTMPTVWNTIKKVASRVATPWAVSDLVLGGMNAENAMVRRQDPEELGVNSYMRNTGALRPEAQKAFGDMQQSYLSGGATHYNYNQFNPEQTYGPREGWATYGNKMLNEDGSGKDTLDYIKPLFWGG
jgi:hypothetical protein